MEIVVLPWFFFGICSEGRGSGMRPSLWMRRARIWVSLIPKQTPGPNFRIIQGGKRWTQPLFLRPRTSEFPKSVDGSSSEKWEELFQVGKPSVGTTNSLDHLRDSLANPCLVRELLEGISGLPNPKRAFLGKG